MPQIIEDNALWSVSSSVVLQALMGGKDFCCFLQQLQAASPALSAPELPTLHALSALAAEFQAVTTSADSSGLQV